jgi:hypothetical protein
MITEHFNDRTIANMEVALERACLLLPADRDKHQTRRLIANKIIECANRGETTLGRLTEVGYAAVKQLTARSGARSHPRRAKATDSRASAVATQSRHHP